MSNEPNTIDVSGLSETDKRLVEKHVQACRNRMAYGNGHTDDFNARLTLKRPVRRSDIYADEDE